ncbi:MAG: cell division protein FtsB [Lysobacterales bacterium]
MGLRPVIALRWTVVVLLVLIAVLQLRLWTDTSGMPGVRSLEESIARQRAENVALRKRNDELAADVSDLKSGREAIEDRARQELGMTRPGEVFYQVIESTPSEDEGTGESRSQDRGNDP